MLLMMMEGRHEETDTERRLKVPVDVDVNTSFPEDVYLEGNTQY